MKTAKRKPAAAPAQEARPASGPPAWWWIAGLAAAFFAVWTAYSPALAGPFVFDDEYLPFLTPGFVEGGLAQFRVSQRALMNAGFWINAKLFGLEPNSYHALNVVFHFVNAVLIFVALRKLLGAGRQTLAIFGAAVFLLHPVQTESVAYVAGRSENFSLMFFLGAYTLFLHKRESGMGWPAALGVLGLFGGAVLSKEHTAALPGLLLLTDLCFPIGKPLDTIRGNWRLYAPLAVASIAGVALVLRVLSEADSAGFAVMPWPHYFFTQWRALWVYLGLFVAPISLNADYDFAISRTPLEHGALFGLFGLLAVTGAAWRYRERFPLAWFGWLAFLLLIAPTSSIVPIKDPVAERRLYLPMIGLLAIVCDLASRWKASREIKGAAACVVLALFGWLTYARSHVWADPEQLWIDTAAKSPGNQRAHFQLAMVYYHAQRCPEALKKFDDAARTGKRDFRLLVDWGLAQDCAGNPDQALMLLREAVALENTAHGRAHIGMVLAKQRKLDDSLKELNAAQQLDPAYDLTYVFRGNVYLLRGELDPAEADYRQALVLNPQNTVAEQMLREVQKRKGAAR